MKLITMKPNSMLPSTLSALCGLLLITGCDKKSAITTEAGPAGVADTIYTGGNIITIHDAAPSAEALAVKDGERGQVSHFNIPVQNHGSSRESKKNTPGLPMVMDLKSGWEVLSK